MNVKKSNPFEQFARASDDEWLSLLIRSITERVIDGISFPRFPNPEVQKITVGGENESALREAFQFFVYSKQVLTRNSICFCDSTRMIDFGVCWGRIARLFLRDVAPQNIIGLEVDEAFIEMSKSLGLPVEIYKVDPLGPSALTSNTFDFVTAYSVFSHLDEIAAGSWIEEFYRVLKPGGILIATTHGELFIDQCSQLATSDKRNKSDRDEMLSRAFSDPEEIRRQYFSGKFVATHAYLPHYGEALISPGYIMSAWGDRFELLEFRQAGQGVWQAVFVLRKRTRRLTARVW